MHRRRKLYTRPATRTTCLQDRCNC